MRVGLSYDLLRLSPCSSIWKQIVRLQYSAPHHNLSKQTDKTKQTKAKSLPIIKQQTQKTFLYSVYYFVSDLLFICLCYFFINCLCYFFIFIFYLLVIIFKYLKILRNFFIYYMLVIIFFKIFIFFS